MAARMSSPQSDDHVPLIANLNRLADRILEWKHRGAVSRRARRRGNFGLVFVCDESPSEATDDSCRVFGGTADRADVQSLLEVTGLTDVSRMRTAHDRQRFW